MTVIHGNNVKAFLDSLLVFCGKTLTFSEKRTTIESVGTTGLWTYNRVNKKSWQVEISGLTKIDSTDGPLDYFTLVNSDFAYSFHTLLVTFEDADGNQRSIAGTVFPAKSSINSPVKSFAEASVTLVGTGPYFLDGSSGSSGGGCVPVSGGSFNPPDAESNTAYSYSFPLSGTAPFSVGTTTKPSWMSANIVGTHLQLGGTPSFSDIGTGITVSVQITNACGDETFSDLIDVNENGRNVFVINNDSSHEVVLQNSNGHVYSFGPSNADDGNIKMPTDTISIITVGGNTSIIITYEFLQSLPSDLINTGTTNGGSNIVTDDLSRTNYLRFTEIF